MTIIQRERRHMRCEDPRNMIQEYLERKDGRDRVVAQACHELYAENGVLDWARQMDETREAAGNDTLPGGAESREYRDAKTGKVKKRQAVLYNHFVVSPSPAGKCTPEEVLALAQLWAARFFGSGDAMTSEPGSLGNFQYMIEVHVDGTHGVPHAHVIVNNTDVETGRRLQIGNKDNDALWDAAQELSRELGMPYLLPQREWRKLPADEREAYLTARGYRRLTKAELGIVGKRGFSWKQALANAARSAKLMARGEEGYIGAMADMGVAVERTCDGSDFLYRHPSRPDRWCCSGAKLGTGFTREACLRELEENRRYNDMDDPESRARVLAKVQAALAGLADPENVVARVEHGTALKDVSYVLQTNRTFNIRRPGHYDEAIASLRAKAAFLRKHGADATAVLSKVSQLERARAIAATGDYFPKARPEDAAVPWTDPDAVKAAARKAAASKSRGYFDRKPSESARAADTPRRAAERDRGEGRSR